MAYSEVKNSTVKAYSEGNVNGLWRLKPTGGDQCEIGVEMPAPEQGTSQIIHGPMDHVQKPPMAVVGDPFAGKPLT